MTKDQAFLRLEKSEEAVVHSASRIYAAMIVSGSVDFDHEEEAIKRAVYSAVRIAILTDEVVLSDDENTADIFS